MQAIATVQTSRFHSATVASTSANVQIDIAGLNITVNDHELLADTRLLLKPGTRYGLIGRNGIGKSTLLRLIGTGGIPGMPPQLRALYVDQVEASSDEERDVSVIEAVIAADKNRAQLLAESKALQEVIDDDVQACRVAKSIITERAVRKKKEAMELADRRSGARGWDARKAALNAIDSVKILEESSADEIKDHEPAAMLSEMFEQLELIDADSADARAREVLSGLGFSKTRQEGPFSALSGGWRTRVALARALFMNPDILLLDEPTNHLDIKAITWLEEYILSLPEEQILIVVSHDRHFLNAISDTIIRLRDAALTYHSGNYDDYERSTGDRAKMKENQKEKIDRKKKLIEQSIQKAKKHAKASGDDKRLGMVASRQKQMENMGMTRGEDGKRLKMSYRVGYHLTAREQITLEKTEAAVHFTIPDPEALKQKGSLVQLRDVSFTYPGATKANLSHIILDVLPGARIAIVGANGAGKSTLVSLMEGKLKPKSGTVERLHGAKIARFDQHVVDALEEGGTGDKTSLAYIKAALGTSVDQEARALLGSFGLKGSTALRPMRTLSGGERVRVALASLFCTPDTPSVLVLDEVTNHLDIWSVAGLVDALKEWAGAVIIVSHDRWFLEEACTDVFLVRKGSVRRLENGVQEYLDMY